MISLLLPLLAIIPGAVLALIETIFMGVTKTSFVPGLVGSRLHGADDGCHVVVARGPAASDSLLT